jgi:hypothetical protein
MVDVIVARHSGIVEQSHANSRVVRRLPLDSTSFATKYCNDHNRFLSMMAEAIAN